MPIFKPKSSEHLMVEVEGKNIKLLTNDAYKSFNSSMLGLGDISKESVATDAIAAVFDLEGFTNFCKQIEPHLSVPLFLSEFLHWLLEEIKSEMLKDELEQGVELWCPLPFFVKFMGDGLLVLWDASATGPSGRRNIVLSAKQVCENYLIKFLPIIKKKVSAPPPILRCGVARGTVYSVGNSNDFVGSCINIASRLQKVGGATFAFNRRGFDLESKKVVSFFKNEIVIKRLAIRGIGDDELIGITKTEYESMSSRDRKQFKDL